jgi:hypothetical protein
MMNRIRKVTNNEFTILNDKIFKLNEVNNYIVFDDAKEAIKELSGFKTTTIYKTVNGKRIKLIDFDDYTNNFIYNKVEEFNKQPYYFLAKLKEMIEQKGHEFIFNDNITFKHDKKINIDDVIDEKATNELYNELVNCPLIQAIEYGKLCRYKEHNKATREDKIKMKKYEMCHLLGLDELTINLLKIFYYGKHLMYNFINIIDIDNFKKSDDAQNIIYFEKLEFVHYLLEELGFKNIFDSKNLINGEVLINKFKNIYNTHAIYINKKKFKINFNIPFIKLDENTTTKQVLGHLNSILANYSIKISYKQKKENNKLIPVYYLEILNDVDELLKYKILKKYKLVDNNNIFTCNKTKLKDLFIFIDSSDDEND